ncbi:unnamed protein product [Brachionus calyciflorus]|uniref:G-protein coupled receptors family 1 profile domain-containing protein n=1 Tax=Brachionus calyciflorus TaxID=104777 RepID=A0A813VYU9_9BILA|nr:unnamed protein product [Brachionus calyciflorus]
MFIHDHWKNFLPININIMVFTATLNTITGSIGFILNLLVLVFLMRVYRAKRREKVYFLFNLAIADIIKVSINIPMNLISGYNGKWMFNSLGCSMYGVIEGLFGFVSITTLAFMSLERFLIVRNPLNSIKLGTKMRLFISLFSKYGFILEGALISCSFDYLSRDLKSRVIMMAMMFGGFVLPFFLILIFYFLTKMELKLKGKYFYKPRASVVVCQQNFSNKRLISSQHYVIQKKKYSSMVKRESLVLRKIILCVLFFTLAWLPYTLLTLYAQYGNNVSKFLKPETIWFPTILAKSSSIYNPIIYTLSHVECYRYYRKKLNQIFTFFTKCST